MLVLSRKPGEKILIGDNVSVTVVHIGPNTVRIGIEAPNGMKIVREELLATSTEHLKPPPEMGAVYADGGYPIHVPRSSTQEECRVEDRGVSAI